MNRKVTEIKQKNLLFYLLNTSVCPKLEYYLLVISLHLRKNSAPGEISGTVIKLWEEKEVKDNLTKIKSRQKTLGYNHVFS